MDDAPFAQFSHPTRFVFVDAATGAVRTTAQGWWPYIDGREVEQWTTTLERWNPKNWAFNNIPAEELPKLIATSQKGEPARGGLVSLLFGHLDWWSTAYAAVPAGEAMVVVQGWAPGHGTNPGFTDDEQAADKFGKDSGTPVFKPAGNKLSDIEEAIRKAKNSGAKDIFFYWTGHGGRTGAGGSYLDFQGTPVAPGDLVDIFRKFPDVSFKVVIDSCYGGGFAQGLIDSGKVLVFLSASSPSEVAYGDWDPKTDPNPGDVGGEFSSGLWEFLQVILASPDLQKKMRADFLGVPEFVGWLLVASSSALAKDAAALTGNTHPVFKTGATPPTPTPTPTPVPLSWEITTDANATGQYNEIRVTDVVWPGPPNTAVTATLTGPGVIGSPTQTTTTDAAGHLIIRWVIDQPGEYRVVVTVNNISSSGTRSVGPWRTPTPTPTPTPSSTPTRTPTPISTSLSFFHTAPGSYSSVFLDVKGQANTVVTVFLVGPSVGAPVTQTGTIGADGTLRITWTIYSYGLYSATGTVGEQSFTAQVNVS